MLLPLDDNIFKKGFCKGNFEVTIDHGPRFWLPAAMVGTVEEHKVAEILLFPDPSGRRLILCPDKYRDIYVEHVKKLFPAGIEAGKSYRKFICTGDSIPVRRHIRVSIKTKFNKDLDIRQGQTVVIIGVGNWYEIWRQDDWEGGNDDKC
jgi:DNA-binding transcriptional regulator/RsmH inhibitor MraZ